MAICHGFTLFSDEGFETWELLNTDNKVLKKLNQLGYEVKGLDKYLERKTLINKKEAEKYIDKLLREKNKK